MTRYRVMVDDNFHYMDESERTELGVFDSAEAALAAGRAVVERSLRDLFKPGMSAAELFDHYKQFGDDPFIVVIDGAPGEKIDFSAWSCAEARCPAVCGGGADAS
jgi:hypothetical protein